MKSRPTILFATTLAPAVENYLWFYNNNRITNTLGRLTIKEHRRRMAA
ncbi:hypothetical protein [Corynebacterium kroppenstedtii]|nr:hypothetical protein [Corynebacterium kroppenstedtii]MDN8625186.1 hypothetical protein [Corynebacterium kroppenstedtii]QRQ64928.1 hypothetical protein I6J23_10560 [Corynebacterium kroppenstedtii]